MKHYQYSIYDWRITDSEGEVSGTSEQFELLESSFGNENVYYRIENGKVVEVICEAFNETGARRAVNKFLDTRMINAN